MAVTQKHRLIAVSSPLGKDVLLFRRLIATEELGRLFEYRLDLLSEDPAIKAADILGQNVTVRLELPRGGTRYFNGYVSHFSFVGPHGRYWAYQATLHPWLWFLTRTADCRIFQEQKTPDIILSIFREHGFTDFEVRLSGSYETREFCVQYRETDFNFVSRLMEKEGIYYYFKHENGKHLCVLADSYSAHDAFPKYEEIAFYSPGASGGAAAGPEHRDRERPRDRDRLEDRTYYDTEIPPTRPELRQRDERNRALETAYADRETASAQEGGGEIGVHEYIYDLRLDQKVQPGAYALNDYDFKAPKKNLRTLSSLPGDHVQAHFEVYDYPGRYEQSAQGEAYARVRIEELQAQHEIVQCWGNVRGIMTGALFKLIDYPRDDQNREYLLTSVTHQVASDEYESVPGAVNGLFYECSFNAIDAKKPYRSPCTTAKPVVQGPQTAMVVGKAGEEIWTDKYGRVKCQFHWDRYGKADENSSCWVRVSHPWAGKSWGAVAIPRIGQEVIVDFLEGDPDQPMITGRVYNNDSMPPYGLPKGAVVSGIKSNSTKGGGGYNEMIMDDTKGKEEVRIHAQYNMNTTVENDQTSTIHNNRTDTVDVDDTESVGSNQKISVGADRTLSVGANQKVSIGSNETVNVGGKQEISVGLNQSLSVGASQAVSIGAQRSTEVGANDELKVGGSQTIDVTGPISINSAAKITLTAGGSKIEIGPAGVTITTGAQVTVMGAMIKLN